MNAASEQYEFIKSSRETLLNYCSTISQIHLNEKLAGFGHGSICSTLTHIANVYLFWLSKFAMQRNVEFFKEAATIDEIRNAFNNINQHAKAFVDIYSNKMMQDISGKLLSGEDFVTTPFKVFTHVITHEFHHKGQILSMSRQLGYTPIDTDVIRFEN